MATIIAEIVGYIAAVVGTSLMLPQVIKSIKTKHVADLSFMMVILYFLNCVLWLVYGVLISAMPVILCNAIAIIISIILMTLKVKYNKKIIS